MNRTIPAHHCRGFSQMRSPSAVLIALRGHPEIDNPSHEQIAAGDVRRARTGPTVAIRRGRFADQVLETYRERAEAGASHGDAHFTDRQIGGSEQVLGPLDPAPCEIADGCLAVRGGKTPYQVELGNSGYASELLQVRAVL